MFLMIVFLIAFVLTDSQFIFARHFLSMGRKEKLNGF